jgi:ribosome-binding factor A
MASSKPPSQRQLRVGEQVRHTIAEILARGDVREPILNLHPISITEVKIGRDLQNATAFFMPLGGENTLEIGAALGRAAPFIRSRIAKALRLRHVPTIVFEVDQTFDYASSINDLLNSPKVQQDLNAPDTDNEVASDLPDEEQ